MSEEWDNEGGFIPNPPNGFCVECGKAPQFKKTLCIFCWLKWLAGTLDDPTHDE